MSGALYPPSIERDSPLVGRARETKWLSATLRGGASNDPRVLFVSGEPGIGKTRLLEFAAQQVAESGGIVLRGSCYEDASMVPYGPFTEALHALIRQRDEDSGAILPVDLAQVLPDWDAGDGPGTSGMIALDREERLRLFDAVARSILDASADRQVVLLLDDLHWADEPSALLLRYITRVLRNSPITIIGAYRDTDLDASKPFEGVLRDLQRERLASRIALRRLSRDESATLVAQLLGTGRESIEPQVFETIQHESEGVPFFIEELVLHLRESGMLALTGAGRWELTAGAAASIPQSVRSVVGHRLVQLPDYAREALMVAAVIGREFSYDLLASVLKRRGREADDHLIACIEEATRRRLIVERQGQPGFGTTFVFAHEQIQSVLYWEMNPVRRRALHQLVGETLEEGESDPRQVAARLAHHFSHGEDLVKAAHYFVLAAEEAAKYRALEQAIHYYNGALEIIESRGSSPGDESPEKRMFEILLARDRLYETGNDRTAQASGIQELLVTADRLDDPETHLEARLRAARYAVRTGTIALALKHASVAQNLAIDLDDRARARAALSRAQAHVGRLLGEPSRLYRPNEDLTAAARLLSEARELAEELGWERAVAWITQELGVVLWALAERDDSDARARARSFFIDALERFRAAGDRKGEITALIALAYRRPVSAASPSSPLQGSYVGFLEEIRRLRQTEHLLSRESDRPRLEALSRMSIHVYARTHGWYETALERACEALEWASSAGDNRVSLHARLGLSETERLLGRADRALDHANHAAAVFETAHASGLMSLARKEDVLNALALAHRAAGRPERAEAFAVERLELARDRGTQPALADATVTLAEVLSDIDGAEEHARATAQATLTHTRDLAGPITWDIRALLVLANLELRAGNASSALDHVSAATSRIEAREIALVWLVTYAALVQGKVLELAGRWDDARNWFERAHEHVENTAEHITAASLKKHFLTAGLYVTEVRETAARYGLTSASPDGSRERERIAGLTPRELEVLALVAAGRTNREISDELFISEKTVARHLTNIFNKIDAQSRTQAAGWAFRHGIA